MTTAIFCAALLAALVFVLSANVSRLRGSSATQFPTDPTDPLFVAIRAHGNAIENVPTLALLILFVGSRDPASWMIAAFVLAAAARYLHAFGILQAGDMTRKTPLRMVGSIGTNLAGVTLVAATLVVA